MFCINVPTGDRLAKYLKCIKNVDSISFNYKYRIYADNLMDININEVRIDQCEHHANKAMYYIKNKINPKKLKINMIREGLL